MWHVTWTANDCYTSDLCVSSHDLCDMRAQCTTFLRFYQLFKDAVQVQDDVNVDDSS